MCSWPRAGTVGSLRGCSGWEAAAGPSRVSAVSLPPLPPLLGKSVPDSSRFRRHQGNIEFVEKEEGALAVVEEVLVDHVAELTATPRELVLRCLLARTVASGGREVIEKGHTAAEASYARDACAKVPEGPACGGTQ